MNRKEQRERDNQQANLRRELEERSRAAEKEEKNRRDIEEGERHAAEEERRKLNADPTITAALVRIDAQEKAEERRAAQAEEQRLATARAELDKEKERRRLVWMTHGGSPESFDDAWPGMVHEIMREKMEAHRSQISNVF